METKKTKVEHRLYEGVFGDSRVVAVLKEQLVFDERVVLENNIFSADQEVSSIICKMWNSLTNAGQRNFKTRSIWSVEEKLEQDELEVGVVAVHYSIEEHGDIFKDIEDRKTKSFKEDYISDPSAVAAINELIKNGPGELTVKQGSIVIKEREGN